MIQLAKKIFWAEQKLAWICGKNISETRLRPCKKRWNAWNIFFSAGFWFVVWLQVVVVAMPCSNVGAKILQKMWEGPRWEGVWLCLGSMGCEFAHIIQLLGCPGKVWAGQ